MTGDIEIRRYQPADRPAIRAISCDTADQGGPVERFFHDREAVADVLVRYYTDYEPESLWVAECRRQIAGYVTGCLDTRRSTHILLKKIIPRVIAGAVVRGALWRLETWRLGAALLGTVFRGGFPQAVDLSRYPAHLHMNIRDGFRGKGVGRCLIDRFKDQARDAGVQGVHVAVLGDNKGGRGFFEAMGFRLLGEQPLFLPEGAWLRKTSTAVYGWTREN